MTKLNLLHLVERNARLFRQEGIFEDLKRNTHLHNWKPNKKKFDADLVDAVLVQLINNIGCCQGVDYAMKAEDLYSPQHRVRLRKIEEERDLQLKIQMEEANKTLLKKLHDRKQFEDEPEERA